MDNTNTNTNTKKHILLVEDDPAIATSLKVTFKREHWQLTWQDNVSSVIPKLQEIYKNTECNDGDNPDITPLSAIILDVGLPDGDGLQLCQNIRSCDDIGTLKNLPILFLTARSDEIDRILGLEMGGDDYCAKPFSPRELTARIKAIWRRQALFNHNDTSTHKSNSTEQTYEISSGIWHYHTNTYQLFWNNHKLELSNTERNILLFLLQHPEQVFSREQLLSAITDHPDHRLARTIDSHIKSIRKTLAIVDSSEVIYTHRGIGYGLCPS